MGKYDFDAPVDRVNSDCLKWDGMLRYYPEAGMIPMWVADMDFRVADEIRDALRSRAEHGVFGYAIKTPEYYNAIRGWFQRRHGLTMEREWMIYLPNVITAIHGAILKFSEPGDPVVLLSPVYNPFYQAIRTLKRTLRECPLLQVEDTYRIDFEALDRALDGAKILLFCSPHNPAGRVWHRDELEQVAALCIKHHVLLVSDEIHSDIILSGNRHIPILNVSEEIRERSILLVSASKTFNMASLMATTVVIPSKTLRDRFAEFIYEASLGMTNCFTIAGAKAAYTYGDQWVDEAVAYIEGNYRYACGFLKEKIPEIRPIRLEGTYLMWLDCRALGSTDEELTALFEKRCRICGETGGKFGTGGAGFYRLNLATQRSTVEEVLNRMEEAIRERR